MKSTLKIFFILVFTSLSINGFSQKVGHIDIAELIQGMPETAAANKDLEALGNQYRDELEALEVELRNKLLTYESNRATWSEDVSAEKFNELEALSRKLDERSAEAETEFQEKQDQMLAPIIDKAQKAVEKVAKEQGVACIYNSRMLLYADATTGFDLLPLVKKELGN